VTLITKNRPPKTGEIKTSLWVLGMQVDVLMLDTIRGGHLCMSWTHQGAKCPEWWIKMLGSWRDGASWNRGTLKQQSSQCQ
jgi:hypothetical protein